MQRWVALALVLGICRAVPATPTPEPGAAPVKQVVRYEDDRVTVALENAPLDAVLRDLAAQSGAELVGTPREPGTRTLSFERAPVKEALERLLGEQNFTLRYDQTGKLKTIDLRGEQEALRRPAEAPLSADAPPASKQHAFWQAFERKEPVALNGELARTFQTDEIGMDHLGTNAIAQDDPRVRRAAVRAIVEALQQDPDMRDRVLDAVGAMSDGELAAFARSTSHHRAEDLVRNVLRETQDRELRERARAVLRELRKTPFKGARPELH